MIPFFVGYVLITSDHVYFFALTMALSWNEIKERASSFSKDWSSAHNEEADAKPFLDAFFNIFGISRKKTATFEQRVQKLSAHDGYIDLLWKGVLLVEMKSKGKNLDKAYEQAISYTHGLKEYELPKYILVCDFERFRLFDLEADSYIEFTLADLVENVHHFGFIAGYQKRIYKEQDPVNIKAAELMGALHDQLRDIGYTDHPLEVYLVRLLFCLFAEDTTIFQRQQFQDFITDYTRDDGSDLAARLQELFQVLNTPQEKRFKNLDERLAEFPYVNGKLFEEPLPIASFSSAMREALLQCCALDWSKISPAIFGAMFQSVMDSQKRRNLGAHYTSEKNILKVIRPLFLDDLYAEFESVKSNERKLQEFHRKLAAMKFFDPACGCGNFLVITYRELRLLELAILRELSRFGARAGQSTLDIRTIMRLDVDMMYGIEYEEFPARIAEVAMWLIDHQMNMLVSAEFGEYFVRLPLRKSAHIVHGNALRIDWKSLHGEQEQFSFILGNPPFIGRLLQKPNQRNDMRAICGSIENGLLLDYVCAWYIKAAEYIRGTRIKVGFVSTNSISQGEQVGILWQELFERYSCKIHFAHRTFSWSNEARGNAAVHVVIIGFACFDIPEKRLFEYENVRGEPLENKVKNINPYLVAGNDTLILSRSRPLFTVPSISKGNQPTDGGHLILDRESLEQFLHESPNGTRFIKKIIGAREFLQNKNRWCLWLKNAKPDEMKSSKFIYERLMAVAKVRSKSPDKKTKEMAKVPHLFREMRNYASFVIVPSTTSENRRYVPMGFGDENVIPTNLLHIVPNGTLFHFGILSSAMHMAWVRYVAGRLKSDYRYSKDIVYNNFPWCEPNEKQQKAIEQAAEHVLAVRAEFPESSLADLYDPLTMPPALVKAHQDLDKAVDTAYRAKPFTSETERVEYLFLLYEQYTANLFTENKPKRTGQRKK